MDIKLIYDGQFFTGDIALNSNDLAIDNSLENAVFISLFTDKRAMVDNEFKKGWWADSYANNEGDEIGSKLWLLGREKVMPLVLIRAKEYSNEALMWLKEDGLVKDYRVEVEMMRHDALKIKVTLILNDGDNESFTHNLELKNALA